MTIYSNVILVVLFTRLQERWQWHAELPSNVPQSCKSALKRRDEGHKILTSPLWNTRSQLKNQKPTEPLGRTQERRALFSFFLLDQLQLVIHGVRELLDLSLGTTLAPNPKSTHEAPYSEICHN